MAGRCAGRAFWVRRLRVLLPSAAMHRSDFAFDLPPELIAQKPLAERAASRLLRLDGQTGELSDGVFTELPGFLEAGDLMVFNDTRVIPARLFGRKASGGRIECLIERVAGERAALAHIRSSKAPRGGTSLLFDNGCEARVNGRRGDLYELEFDRPVLAFLDAHGHVPLPPYIDRSDNAGDRERYQTVYADKAGAIAAPTAGLHFDDALLAALDRRGIRRAFITLHVGAGTFQPVRVENLAEHRMHSEVVQLEQSVCDEIAAAKSRGSRVVAVGTTSVRALESAATEGAVRPLHGETDIFIRPGYEFRCVDAMVTNFHLPESTLLMLLCAFAGYEQVMRAYAHAVAQRYRFFSYGDAMFVTRRSAEQLP